MTDIIHIVIARKPIEHTIICNCLKHGTGAINIDATRIHSTPTKPFIGGSTRSNGIMGKSSFRTPWIPTNTGRFPANVILDDSIQTQSQFNTITPSNFRHTKANGKSSLFHNGSYSHITANQDQLGSITRYFYTFNT